MYELRIETNTYEEKYLILCRKLTAMTPGGSEFANDPDRCIDWLWHARHEDREILKSYLRRINGNRRLRRLWHRAAKREARCARLQKN